MVIFVVAPESRLFSSSEYCKRDSKTIHEGKKLVSGVNCLPESAYREFMNTKLQYGKTEGRKFYHFTQSFHPDEKDCVK